MGLIMTKKRCSLQKKSLDMLMRISYFKKPFDMETTKRIIQNWRKTQQNFSYNTW